MVRPDIRSAFQSADVRARLALTALFCAFFFPELFLGHVIAPSENRQALGLPSGQPEHAENRRFDDVFALFMPSLALAGRDEADSWLTAYDPYSQLGMPLRPFLYTEAFAPTWLFEQLGCAPLRSYTLLALLAVWLTLLGGYSFCRSLRHEPLPALVGAVCIGLGIRTLFWLNVAQYLFSTAFMLLLLAAAVRFLSRPDRLRAAVVVLWTFLLLLSGRKQLILFDGYLIAAFCAVFAFGRLGMRTSLPRLVGLFGAASVGLLLALPPYIDLVQATGESMRSGLTQQFFTSGFMQFNPFVQDGELSAKLSYLVGLVEPYWLGNPMLEDRPFGRYMGVSICAPLLLASLFSWSRCRDRWFWLGVVLVAVVASLSAPVFRGILTTVGLGMSRFWFLELALVPLALMAAETIRLAGEVGRRRGLISLATVLVLLGALAGIAAHHGIALRSGPLAASGAGLLLVGIPLIAGWRRLLALALIGLTVAYALPLKLGRPAGTVSRDSPLVSTLRKTLEPDQRFVVLAAPGHRPRILIPNVPTALGLGSAHFYDPLASRRAHAMAAAIGGGRGEEYRRAFDVVHDAALLCGETARRARIDVVVAVGVGFPCAGFSPVARPPGATIFRREASAPAVWYHGAGGMDPESDGAVPLEVLKHRSDRWKGRFEPFAADGAVFFSRQYDRNWIAFVDGLQVRTQPLDDLFLEVPVRAGAREVEIVYRPAARWLWVSYLLLLLLLVASWVTRPARVSPA